MGKTIGENIRVKNQGKHKKSSNLEVKFDHYVDHEDNLGQCKTKQKERKDSNIIHEVWPRCKKNVL